MEHAPNRTSFLVEKYARMTDAALVGGICVDAKKSMSRFTDAYPTDVSRYQYRLIKELEKRNLKSSTESTY